MCAHIMYKNIIKFIDYFFDVHFMYCIALGLPYHQNGLRAMLFFFSVFTSIDNGLYIHNLLQGEILEEIVA